MLEKSFCYTLFSLGIGLGADLLENVGRCTMAEDVEETLYQVTCRRPTWPFEDWRYEVFTKSTATVPSTGEVSAPVTVTV